MCKIDRAEAFAGFYATARLEALAGALCIVIFAGLLTTLWQRRHTQMLREVVAATEARRQLAAIVDSSNDAIIGKTLDGIITSWNTAAQKMYGYTADEASGRPVSILIPPDHVEELPAILDRIKRGKGATNFETERVRKDGRRIDVALTISPVTDAQGTLVGASTIARDITERQRAAARIQHLNDVLRSVRSVNELMARERDQQRLLAEACNILVRTRGYRLVWIGQTEAGSARVVPVARAGEGVDYLDTVTITWDESATGQGPTGTAIRTRRPAVCQNMATEPGFAPWRESALAKGYTSSASAPMVYGGRVFGALSVYAHHPEAFDEEEVALLSELAADLAFALASIGDETERQRAEQEKEQ